MSGITKKFLFGNSQKIIIYCAFELCLWTENNWSTFQRYNVNNTLVWPNSLSTTMKEAWFLLLRPYRRFSCFYALTIGFFSILIITIHHHRYCFFLLSLPGLPFYCETQNMFVTPQFMGMPLEFEYFVAMHQSAFDSWYWTNIRFFMTHRTLTLGGLWLQKCSFVPFIHSLILLH